MRWLLYGPMTGAVAAALKRHDHQACDPGAPGLAPGAAPADALRAAHAQQLDVMTTDPALANALFDPDGDGDRIRFNRSIVFLHVGPGDVEQDDAVDRLFQRYRRLSPGRLYTVTESRVKIRQLPTAR